MLPIESDQNVHFIGIGGIGMSGIAEVLLKLGFSVSGSDIQESANTKKLEVLGAKIFIGHSGDNIIDRPVVVYSSAISLDNPERQKVLELKLPEMKRAEMLAELMKLKLGVAIGGTHGKTTTTSILATILHESQFDPTYIIGGVVKNLDGHAKVGTGKYLVAEADESDGSFLLLNPIFSVITNVDDDHLDFYKTRENLNESFLKFANNVPFYGACSLNIHDPQTSELIKNIKKPFVTFGIEGKDSYCEGVTTFEAKNLKNNDFTTEFSLFYKGEDVGEVSIGTIGEHNTLNALAAISIAYKMGVSFEQVISSIKHFDGVGRRMQKLSDKENAEVFDDYAHHPTEILTTINAVKNVRKNKKLIVFFEPHRYSRTRDCWENFLHCFNSADKVYVLPIYPASEKPIPGITSTNLIKDINKMHPDLVSEIGSYDEFTKSVKNLISEDVVILTLGAGAIGRKIREIVS